MFKSQLKDLLPDSLRPVVRQQQQIWSYRWQQWTQRFTASAEAKLERQRYEVVFRADTHLGLDERMLLYAIVRGTRPERALEVGSLFGGSAAIIATAMEANQRGRLMGLDPEPALRMPESDYYGRFTLLAHASPDGVSLATEQAGGKFDLVHLDGINIYTQAHADLCGVLPHLNQRAYVLINNPFHFGVQRAVEEVLRQEPRLRDAGFLGSWIDPDISSDCAYAGLRLLVWSERSDASATHLVQQAYSERGLVPPEPKRELENHDVWYCKTVKACPRCASTTKPTAKENSENSAC